MIINVARIPESGLKFHEEEPAEILGFLHGIESLAGLQNHKRFRPKKLLQGQLFPQTNLPHHLQTVPQCGMPKLQRCQMGVKKLLVIRIVGAD